MWPRPVVVTCSENAASQVSALLAGGFAALVHFQVRRDEGTHQPGPHGAQVIGGVTLGDAAFIMRAIAGVVAGERAQAQGRQQFGLHGFDYAAGFFGRQHAVRETYREDLVGAQGAVGVPVFDDVVEAAGGLDSRNAC